MKYLTEKQLIRQWAKQAKQSLYLKEDTSSHSLCDAIEERYGKYVADNGYSYFIALEHDDKDDDIDDFWLFLTSNNADELINSKEFNEDVVEYIAEYITDDEGLCGETFEFTYHDDSDYSYPYGYGQAGDYDADEIKDKSYELYDDADTELRDCISDQLELFAKEPSVEDNWRFKLKNDVFIFLGTGYVPYTKFALIFGITSYKQHDGKLLSRGKVVPGQ